MSISVDLPQCPYCGYESDECSDDVSTLHCIHCCTKYVAIYTIKWNKVHYSNTPEIYEQSERHYETRKYKSG